MLDAADVSARRLRWDELPDAHRAVYRDQWAAEREVADWFSLPSLTWEQERAALMAGRSLGWMPEGWVGIGGRSGSGRRESAGDAFGAKVTDCSACSDSVEEWPGNNIQNVNATDWEPDGDGGCVRTLTQRDYTGSCVAGTSGGTPDGGECNNGEDPDSPCYGSNTSKTKAYVYEDGQCYTKATCDCDGKEIRGGGQNCPDSQVTYTMRAVEDHSCSGTKRDAAWGGKEGPELEDDACKEPSSGKHLNWLPDDSAPPGATVEHLDGADAMCGRDWSSWEAVTAKALSLLRQDMDLVRLALCRANVRRCEQRIVDLLSGGTPQTYRLIAAINQTRRNPAHPDWSSVDRLASAETRCTAHSERWYEPNVDAFTNPSDIYDDAGSVIEFGEAGVYLQLHNDGVIATRLYQAGYSDSAADISAELINLAGTLLHELTHVCDPAGTRDGVADGLAGASYSTQDAYVSLAKARYL